VDGLHRHLVQFGGRPLQKFGNVLSIIATHASITNGLVISERVWDGGQTVVSRLPPPVTDERSES
jgi:hypothetical protein